jgi:acyl carrier protein
MILIPERFKVIKGSKEALDQTQIYARLETIFHDVFDDEAIKLTPALTAQDVDGWDSLTHIRLMLSVEKAFKIKFSTSEIGSLKNVQDLVELIKKRV